jgi:hypothetical protein
LTIQVRCALHKDQHLIQPTPEAWGFPNSPFQLTGPLDKIPLPHGHLLQWQMISMSYVFRQFVQVPIKFQLFCCCCWQFKFNRQLKPIASG